MAFFYLNEDLDRVEGIWPTSDPIRFPGTTEVEVPDDYTALLTKTAEEIIASATTFEKERESKAIKTDLDALDRQSARPLRAKAVGTATEADKVVLAEIEAQVVKLRARLAELDA